MNDEEVQIISTRLPKGYRKCFVPMCKNNSVNSPSKVFVHVPNESKRKKQWWDIVRRTDKPTASHFYCCQDHFKLEEDLENYVRFKLMGAPIHIKENVVPRYFDCQPDRKTTKTCIPRPSYKKLQLQKKLIQEIMLEQENQDCNFQESTLVLQSSNNDFASKQSKNILQDITDFNLTINKNCEGKLIHAESSSEFSKFLPKVHNKENISVTSNCKSSLVSASSSNAGVSSVQSIQNDQNDDDNLHPSVKKLKLLPNGDSIICSQKNNKKHVKNKSIQVCLKDKRTHKFRSVAVQCIVKTTSRSTSPCNLEKIGLKRIQKPPYIDLPIKNIKQFDSDLNTYTTTTTSTSTSIPVSEFTPSSGEICESEEFDLQIKRNALNMTNYFINNDSKRYVGVPQDWLWIIDQLHLATGISTDNIKLTLMKIKLNDTFVRLGHQFGMSSTKASIVFNTSIIKLANVLKKFIYFPDQKTVKKTMPIPFRANYSDVAAIIDGFEVQIKKPINPVHQSLTWSEYTKSNTLKYLVSCTTDGMINFISTGYGGRISDTNLFEVCGIMDKLKPNCTVMADRGFKQIDTVLATKKL